MDNHYLDNDKFERSISLYKSDPKKYEIELVKQLDLLIDNIFNTFKFSVDYDDAKQDCFLLSLRIVKNFTDEKGSAFNYFTTIILNNLRLIYTKHRKYKNKIDNYMEFMRKRYPDLN
jgi:hypothetical protein